jgi:hypothetical protein
MPANSTGQIAVTAGIQAGGPKVARWTPKVTTIAAQAMTT